MVDLDSNPIQNQFLGFGTGFVYGMGPDQVVEKVAK